MKRVQRNVRFYITIFLQLVTGIYMCSKVNLRMTEPKHGFNDLGNTLKLRIAYYQ